MELITAWFTYIAGTGLPVPVVITLGVLIPGLVILLIWIAKKKPFALFRNRSSRQFAEDYHTAAVTRAAELESLVRGNVISLVNNLISPYLRENYLAKIEDPQTKLERYNLLQPTMSIIKSSLDEFFYTAVRQNGFVELPETELMTYCWQKSGGIIDVIEDKCCRYVNRDEFVKLEVFERVSEPCTELRNAIYQLLSRPIDPSKPTYAGLMPQIVQHEKRTVTKLEELLADPFLRYNKSSGGSQK